MTKLKIALSAAVLFLLAAGLVAGFYLVRQQQDLRSKASSQSGTASVSLSPASGDLNAGGSPLKISVSFNPAGNIISAVAVRLTYPYTGTLPTVTAGTPVIDPGFTSGGEWACPVKSVGASGGAVNIDIACANTGTAGFTGTEPVTLASFNLTAGAGATAGDLTVSFDPKESIITKKTDSQDVLLTPSSKGTFTIISGNNPTPKYKCSSGLCTRDDTNGTFTTATCDNTCTASVTPKYKCSGSSCVRDDTNGTFTSYTCDNTCTVSVATPKYKCSGSSCMRDDTNGTTTDSNCNYSCVSNGATSLPVTGNPLLTVAVFVSGLISVLSFVVLRH